MNMNLGYMEMYNNFFTDVGLCGEHILKQYPEHRSPLPKYIQN